MACSQSHLIHFVSKSNQHDMLYMYVSVENIKEKYLTDFGVEK